MSSQVEKKKFRNFVALKIQISQNFRNLPKDFNFQHKDIYIFPNLEELVSKFENNAIDTKGSTLTCTPENMNTFLKWSLITIMFFFLNIQLLYLLRSHMYIPSTAIHFFFLPIFSPTPVAIYFIYFDYNMLCSSMENVCKWCR